MNKNKIKIVTSIPASMSNFEETSNPHLTKAKLRVFHSGKTQDGRTFTESFAEKLARTIGGTPVVARYDAETDDFEGHAYNQFVYGFVPEEAEVEVSSDSSGKSWFTTEVRLFTERRDVGEVARKIIGHSQSLELNPDTVKVEYVFKGDELEEMKFLDGDLIGLSVLGISQQPAFEGSGFFEKRTEEERESTLAEIIAKYLSIPNEIVIEAGGETMDKKVIYEGNGFTIFRKDKKIYIEDQGGTLDDITDALVEEEVIEEPENQNSTEPTEPEEPLNLEGEGEVEEGNVEVNEDDADGDGDEGGGEFEELEEPIEEIEESDNFENEPEESEEGEDEEDVNEETFEEESEGMEPEAEINSANEAALGNEEREELENYRREHKKTLISEYEEYLGEDVYNQFLNEVDKFDIAELEKELAYASMKAIKENNGRQNTFAFAINSPETSGEDAVSRLVQKYKN